MSAWKRAIEEKQIILFKSMQDKILYYICKYFIMWDVQPQDKNWSEKWVFVKDQKDKKIQCFWHQ